jgi:hypothetical protein
VGGEGGGINLAAGPSIDRKHNIGKYTFAYSIMCYIL